MLSSLQLTNVNNYRRESSYQEMLIVKDRLETLVQQESNDKFTENCIRDCLKKISNSDIKGELIVLECLVYISGVISKSRTLSSKVYRNEKLTKCCRDLLEDMTVTCREVEPYVLESSMKKLSDIVFNQYTTRTNYVLMWKIFNKYEQLKLLGSLA